MRMDEFLAMPVVKDSFPLVFRNGATWTEFIVHCNDCSRPVPSGSVRGPVQDWGTRFRIDAHALCPDCNVLSRVKVTMTDDMMMSTSGPEGVLWFKGRSPVSSWFRRLLRSLLQWF